MVLRTTDISSWDVSSALRGTYSANINLINSENDYLISDLKGTDVEIAVATSAHVSSDIDDPDLVFAGSKNLIKGAIADIRQQEGLSSDVVSIGVKSYFAKLARKPIATATSIGLSSILTKYAKLDSTIYDISSMGTGNVAGPLNGNNMLEQLRKCAQAARSYMFIDHEGIMRVEAWKDASDPVEFEIPPEALISASRASSSGILPTQIRMRGGFYQRYDVKAEMNRSGANPAGGASPGAQPAQSKGGGTGGGSITKCRKQGMGEGTTKVTVEGIDASEDDLYSSEVSISSGSVVNVEITEGPSMTITSEPPGGWENTGSGSVVPDSEAEVSIEGRIRDMRASESPEVDAPVAQEHEGVKDKKETAKQEALASGGVMIHMFPMGGGPGPAGGAGSAGGGGNQSPIQLSVSMSEIQLEAYAEDPDLTTEFGTVYEQMENTAIVSREQLHDCIVRRFQEIKMTRKAWEVNCAFMPAININKVVQFTTPEITTLIGGETPSDSGGTVVTGIVTQLSYSWSADSNQITQKMIVESFEDIGATTYVSSNLVKDWRLLGYGGNSDWDKSGEYAYVSGGRIRLTVSDNATGMGYVELAQTGMEVGASYTFSFETDHVLGTDNLDTTYGGVSIGTAKTVTFTATSASYLFRWELSATSTDTQSWLINQISLIKTHVA